jgi:hypothetical protein
MQFPKCQHPCSSKYSDQDVLTSSVGVRNETDDSKDSKWSYTLTLFILQCLLEKTLRSQPNAMYPFAKCSAIGLQLWVRQGYGRHTDIRARSHAQTVYFTQVDK